MDDIEKITKEHVEVDYPLPGDQKQRQQSFGEQ
jgi:hypothetical protein